MNILNLPGWEVTGHTQTKTDYRIEAVYTPEPTACPECSTLFDRLYRHGKREQEIRDLPAHGKRVVIALTRKRYRCQGCGRTFLQPLPDVDDRAQMTRRLAEWVGEQSITRTFTDVATEVGLTNVTVRNVFDAYVERLDRQHKFWAPTQLGIDEVHLLRQPRCVFTDLQGRAIIGVLAKRDKATVTAALQTLHLNEPPEVLLWGTRVFKLFNQDAAKADHTVTPQYVEAWSFAVPPIPGTNPMPEEGKYGTIYSGRVMFPPGMPIFLLLAQDKNAPGTILDYADRCRATACPENHVNAVLRAAERFREWQLANPEKTKNPD